MKTPKRVIEEVTVVGKDLRSTIETLLRDPTVYRLQVRKSNGSKLFDIPAVIGVPTATVLWPYTLAAIGVAYLINYKIVIERRTAEEIEAIEISEAVQKRTAAAQEAVEDIAVAVKDDAETALDQAEAKVDSAAQKARNKAQKAADSAEAKVDQAAEQVEAQADKAAKTVKKKADQAARGVQSKAAKASDKAKKAADQAEQKLAESDGNSVAQPPEVPAEQVTVAKSAPATGDARAMSEAQRNPDDLKRVKGIGESYEGVLNQADIYTFKQLAHCSVAKLERIFDEADQRRPAGLETWPEKAEMLVVSQETGLAAEDEVA